MKLIIFSIHDSAASAFIQPFYSLNVATGLRIFGQAVNDPDTMFAKHPGDYTLFELGSFDQDDAKFDLHITPINHGLAIQHRTNPPAAAPLPSQPALSEVMTEEGPGVISGGHVL